jgi:hypothetical protein
MTPQENAIMHRPVTSILVFAGAGTDGSRTGSGTDERRYAETDGRGAAITGGGVVSTGGGVVSTGDGVVSTGGGVTPSEGRAIPTGCVAAAGVGFLRTAGGDPAGGVRFAPTFILKLLRPR